MRMTVLLDPPTEYQQYDDDCKLPDLEAKVVPVKIGDRVIGRLVRAWVKDGGLWGEIQVDDDYQGDVRVRPSL